MAATVSDWGKLYNRVAQNQTNTQINGLYDNCIMAARELGITFASRTPVGICCSGAPNDRPELFAYNMLHLMSEIGEVLQADKRWKSYRKDEFNREDKKSELADCFVCLLNAAVWSGFTSDEMYNAVVDAAKKYASRITHESFSMLNEIKTPKEGA